MEWNILGADVNRGQRSSSLHYAACFGRPAIAKVLLRYGANADLRDEDGKTPLDKARERHDQGMELSNLVVHVCTLEKRSYVVILIIIITKYILFF